MKQECPDFPPKSHLLCGDLPNNVMSITFRYDDKWFAEISYRGFEPVRVEQVDFAPTIREIFDKYVNKEK